MIMNLIFILIKDDSIIERITLRYLDPISGERYHMVIFKYFSHFMILLFGKINLYLLVI